jgi:hypothetical protein
VSQSRHLRWIRLGAAAALAFIVLMIQAGWFTVILESPDPAEAALRDWIQFHRTAERIVSGRAADIYPVDFAGDGRPEFTDGFYFLYPPFAAWVTLPLAVLSRWAAYLACVLAVAAGTVLAAAGILRALRVVPLKRFFAVLGTVGSAPWNTAVLLGHLSGWLVLSPSLALLAWARQRPGLAGAALALLLAKPNWGLPLLFFLLCGRRWEMVGGFLLGGVVLVLISLPLGPGLWGDWIQTMLGYRALIADATPPWKQATLFASLQSLAGRSGSDPWLVGSWIVLSVPLMGAVAMAWFRRGSAEGDFPRLLGLALLATLVANPYAYFYDAMLVLPPALVLWTQPHRYRDPRLRRGAMTASLATWAWMHLQFFILREGAPSLVGLGLGVWLLLELADLQPPRHGSIRWSSKSRRHQPGRQSELHKPEEGRAYAGGRTQGRREEKPGRDGDPGQVSDPAPGLMPQGRAEPGRAPPPGGSRRWRIRGSRTGDRIGSPGPIRWEAGSIAAGHQGGDAQQDPVDDRDASPGPGLISTRGWPVSARGVWTLLDGSGCSAVLGPCHGPEIPLSMGSWQSPPGRSPAESVPRPAKAMAPGRRG